MTRARPLDAVLAALATVAVILPATTLFSSSTWVQPAVLLVGVVTLTGVLGRRLGARGIVVALLQLIGAVLGLAWVHGQGHLWHGLPSWETLRAFRILLDSALHTVLTYSAPAPTNRGISLALGIIVALTAVIVDYIAVTRRAPALAGLPLLAAYLAVAANAGEGLPVAYFLVPAAAWLALVGRQGVATMRRWSTAVTRSSTEGSPVDPAPGFAAVGRFLGIGALVAAVVLTALVPHMPTTFLADGLGQADGSRGGGGGGAIRLNSTLDISRSLGDRSERPVFVYTTNAPKDDPLRVDVLEAYDQGEWREGPGDSTGLMRALAPVDATDDVKRARYRITVEDNRMRPPQVAMPRLPVQLDLDPTSWAADTNGTVRLQRAASEYTADFLELQPTDAQFAGGADQLLTPNAGSLQGVDPALAERLDALANEVIPAGATPLEAARAIQSYFRGGRFAYSLELAEPTDDSGRSIMLDPLSNFLETKQGYCVQFATAMVMLSRTVGIPARMAIGFLPGPVVDGKRVVRASDAHAWPELYFSGLGWMRFEPTPGGRSGAAPDYTFAPTSTGSTTAPTPTPGATTTPVPNQRPETDPGATEPTTVYGSTSAGPVRWLAANWQVLLVLLAGILGMLLLPVGAWVRRRQARHRAADEAARVEADWAALLSRLGDIGVVPPEGATPRQSGAFVARDAYLSGPAAEAMTRVVAGVETARYAAPERRVEPVHDDARTVWRAASGVRRRRDRLRAALLPGDGLRFWLEARDAALRLPRHLTKRRAR